MTTKIKGSNLGPAISIVTTSDIITEGKLGVGIDTPLGVIHAKSEVNSLLVLESEDNNSDIIFMDTVGSTRIRSAGDQLQFWTGGDASTIATNASVALTLTDDVTVANNLVIGGNLTVNGTTTTLNTATLDVEDINITIAKGALDSATADGAGITVDGAGATLLYNSAPDAWSFNKNVGIRTEDPESQLHIYQPSGELGLYVTRTPTIAGGASLGLTVDSTGSRIYGYGDRLSFWTAATGGTADNRLHITSSGNVEIYGSNTNGVSQKFLWDAANNALKLHNSDTAGELAINSIINDQQNGYWRSSLIFTRDRDQITWNPDTSLWTHAGGGSTDWSAIAHKNDSFDIYRGAPSAGGWSVSNADFVSDYLALTIDDNRNVGISQSLGIGTDSPSTPLEIKKLSDATIRLNYGEINSNDAEDYYGGVEFFAEGASYNRPVVSAYMRAIHTRAGTGHTNSDAGLIFGTSTGTGDAVATERMRIDSVTGYVGINTNDPATPLHVSRSGSGPQGIARFEAKDGATSHFLSVGVDDTANIVEFRSTGTSGGGYTFYTGNDERVRIESTGKVGIGTDNPAGIFHANDTASYPITLSRDNGTDANTSIRYKQATTSWYTGANYNNLFAFKYNDPDLGASPLMTIDTTGNLEIAGDLNTLSDRTLKDNIEPIQNASDIIDQLNGYSFDWKEREGKKGHGVIAQELEEVLPTLVSEREDGIKTVNYLELIPFLIEAVKTQNNRIKALEALLNK
jgi:hypothetical protein